MPCASWPPGRQGPAAPSQSAEISSASAGYGTCPGIMLLTNHYPIFIDCRPCLDKDQGVGKIVQQLLNKRQGLANTAKSSSADFLYASCSDEASYNQSGIVLRSGLDRCVALKQEFIE